MTIGHRATVNGRQMLPYMYNLQILKISLICITIATSPRFSGQNSCSEHTAAAGLVAMCVSEERRGYCCYDSVVIKRSADAVLHTRVLRESYPERPQSRLYIITYRCNTRATVGIIVYYDIGAPPFSEGTAFRE